jgi:hypothetical protein
MKLTTPMQITAADSDSRTITGRIVAFNEPANASTGKVVFARGSIVPQDVFLNLNMTLLAGLGKSISMAVNDKEMTATFKIANTTAGTDALSKRWMDCAMDSQLNWLLRTMKCKRMEL